MNNDKNISACIDAIIEKYGKNTKIDKQTIVRMAQEYDLNFEDISEIEKILDKFNITIFEGKTSKYTIEGGNMTINKTVNKYLTEDKGIGTDDWIKKTSQKIEDGDEIIDNVVKLLKKYDIKIKKINHGSIDSSAFNTDEDDLDEEYYSLGSIELASGGIILIEDDFESFRIIKRGEKTQRIHNTKELLSFLTGGNI